MWRWLILTDRDGTLGSSNCWCFLNVVKKNAVEMENVFTQSLPAYFFVFNFTIEQSSGFCLCELTSLTVKSSASWTEIKHIKFMVTGFSSKCQKCQVECVKYLSRMDRNIFTHCGRKASLQQSQLNVVHLIVLISGCVLTGVLSNCLSNVQMPG